MAAAAGFPSALKRCRELETLAAEYQIPFLLEPLHPSHPERSEGSRRKSGKDSSLRSE